MLEKLSMFDRVLLVNTLVQICVRCVAFAVVIDPEVFHLLYRRSCWNFHSMGHTRARTHTHM